MLTEDPVADNQTTLPVNGRENQMLAEQARLTRLDAKRADALAEARASGVLPIRGVSEQLTGSGQRCHSRAPQSPCHQMGHR